jgi:hypothetical protein
LFEDSSLAVEDGRQVYGTAKLKTHGGFHVLKMLQQNFVTAGLMPAMLRVVQGCGILATRAELNCAGKAGV